MLAHMLLRVMRDRFGWLMWLGRVCVSTDFAQGGAQWFVDLGMADPTNALPIIVTASFIAVAEVSHQGSQSVSQPVHDPLTAPHLSAYTHFIWYTHSLACLCLCTGGAGRRQAADEPSDEALLPRHAGHHAPPLHHRHAGRHPPLLVHLQRLLHRPDARHAQQGAQATTRHPRDPREGT